MSNNTGLHGLNIRTAALSATLICAAAALLAAPAFAATQTGMNAENSGMGGGMGTGGTGTVIDPPLGAPFQDPPEMGNQSTTPGVVQVTLEVKLAPIDINGTSANLFTYNGFVPGQTIRGLAFTNIPDIISSWITREEVMHEDVDP